MKYVLTEKNNHLAVHGFFDSKVTADRFLKDVVPVYVAKGFFSNKKLKTDDFEVIPDPSSKKSKEN